MWVSSELAGHSTFPGLSNVIKVTERVKHLRRGEWVESEQYAVTSLSDIDPKRALSLVRGHWRIENSMFHVKDDSFGEDRHVMQHHGSGAVLSLLRNVALTLLRAPDHCGRCRNRSQAEHRDSAFNQLLHYFHPDFGKTLLLGGCWWTLP